MLRDLLPIGSAGLILLLLVSLLVTRCSPADLAGGSALVEGVETSAPVYEAPAVLEALATPHAVLVLDVSGSMRQSDPSLLQVQAAEQFYTVFAAIGREALPPQAPPRISVVLYGTQAQTIAWEDGPEPDSEPWLDVTSKNFKRFQQAMYGYLGGVGNDLRRGWDTDHLAAIQAASALARSVSSSAVVFMTDGLTDPHPLLTPAISVSGRSKHMEQVQTGAASEIERRRTVTTVPWHGAADWIDMRALGVEELQLTPDELDRYFGLLQAEVTSLQGASGEESVSDSSCVGWIPIFLSSSASLGRGREILGSASNCGNSTGAVLGGDVRDPADLVPRFVDALIPWFRLSRRDWLPSRGPLLIDSSVQSMVVIASSESFDGSVTMSSGARTIELSGDDRVRVAVIPSPSGGWEFDPSAHRISSAVVYLRPRFAWVLAAPTSVSSGSDDGAFPVELLLYSLDSGEVVSASSVLASFPDSLPVRMFRRDAQSRSDSLEAWLILVQGDGPRARAGYRNMVDISRLGLGRWTAEVDLERLMEGGPALSDLGATTSFEVLPELRVRITDPTGRTVRLRLSVPREAQSVADFFGGGNE